MIFREELWFLVALAILTYFSWKSRKKKQDEFIRIPKKINWKTSEKFRSRSFLLFGAFSLVSTFWLKSMNFQLLQHGVCASEISYSLSHDNFKDFPGLTYQEFTQKQKSNSSLYLALTNTSFSVHSRNALERIDTPKYSSQNSLQLCWSTVLTNLSGSFDFRLLEVKSTFRHGCVNHSNNT